MINQLNKRFKPQEKNNNNSSFLPGNKPSNLTETHSSPQFLYQPTYDRLGAKGTNTNANTNANTYTRTNANTYTRTNTNTNTNTSANKYTRTNTNRSTNSSQSPSKNNYGVKPEIGANKSQLTSYTPYSRTFNNKRPTYSPFSNIDEEEEEEKSEPLSKNLVAVNNNLNNNKDKAHFFIGNIFNNPKQIKILKVIKKKILKRYQLKDYHSSYPFCTNILYLGYLDQNTANTYMKNIISQLLIAVESKFNELVCKYTRYTISFDKSYYKIALEYDDENNYLSKIIIPYLKNEGIQPIYNKVDTTNNPSVNLFFYKSSNKMELSSEGISVFIPYDAFTINSLSLIKGVPTRIRSGTPSLHDQMHFEEMQNFTFPLKKSF